MTKGVIGYRWRGWLPTRYPIIGWRRGRKPKEPTVANAAQIVAFRCMGCDYLEFYAGPGFVEK
jgi:hypothetical protein